MDEKYTYSQFEPTQSMSLANISNSQRGLYEGDFGPLRGLAELILDLCEYATDAAAVLEYAGTGITVTRAAFTGATVHTGSEVGNSYLIGTVDVTGNRDLARSLAINISGCSELKLWDRSDIPGSAIKFYLKDGSANISYWDITTEAGADAWQQETFDLTTPDSNSGTIADLGDIEEYGFTGLDASGVYWFDVIKVTNCGMRIAVEASSLGDYYEGVHVDGTVVSTDRMLSPVVVAPSANPRIDILTITSAGVLAWVTGDEAVTPTAKYASVTDAVMPLLCVYQRVGMTYIVDYIEKDNFGAEGYIYKDIRPLYSKKVSTYTGGDGIDVTANAITVDLHGTNPALEFDGGKIRVKVDDATIERVASGLQVKVDGINDTHLDLGVGANQINSDTFTEGSTNLFLKASVFRFHSLDEGGNAVLDNSKSYENKWLRIKGYVLISDTTTSPSLVSHGFTNIDDVMHAKCTGAVGGSNLVAIFDVEFYTGSGITDPAGSATLPSNSGLIADATDEAGSYFDSDAFVYTGSVAHDLRIHQGLINAVPGLTHSKGIISVVEVGLDNDLGAI